MPKPGFKSVTVSDAVYENLQSIYKKIAPELKIFSGINSFSGFISFSINTLFKDEDLFQMFVNKLSRDNQEMFKKLREMHHA